MNNLLFIIIAFSNLLFIQSHVNQTFYYTGSDQTYTVPAEVDKLFVQLWGAGGAGGNYDQVSGATVYNFGGG